MQFRESFLLLRRSGRIRPYVSIHVNESERCIQICCDGGRLCRPLIIVDRGVSRVGPRHIQELMEGVRTFEDFVTDGLIEYVDVNEENDCLVSVSEKQINSGM